MNEAEIARILKNTKFTMEMEGFLIDREQEDVGRRILTGEVVLTDYIESIIREAQRFVYEV